MESRDRYEDRERDVIWWQAQDECRMKLKGLVETVQIRYYASAWNAIKLLEKHSGSESRLT